MLNYSNNTAHISNDTEFMTYCLAKFPSNLSLTLVRADFSFDSLSPLTFNASISLSTCSMVLRNKENITQQGVRTTYTLSPNIGLIHARANFAKDFGSNSSLL